MHDYASRLLQLNFGSKMNGFKVANPGIFIFGRPLALFPIFAE